MKNRFLLLTAFVLIHATDVLGQAGIEQYYYWQQKEAITMVPIVHFQGAKNWYGEARFNYEEIGSFSLYAGKNFSKDGKRFSYSLTPIVGGVMGKLNGGSLGLNMLLEFDDLFLCSQSQFTFSPGNRKEDFLFSWTELGYQPLNWFFFGVSVQHTNFTHQGLQISQCGGMIGFVAGKWSFPVYGFNLSDASRYFVVGINLGIGSNKPDR